MNKTVEKKLNVFQAQALIFAFSEYFREFGFIPNKYEDNLNKAFKGNALPKALWDEFLHYLNVMDHGEDTYVLMGDRLTSFCKEHTELLPEGATEADIKTFLEYKGDVVARHQHEVFIWNFRLWMKHQAHLKEKQEAANASKG